MHQFSTVFIDISLHVTFTYPSYQLFKTHISSCQSGQFHTNHLATIWTNAHSTHTHTHFFSTNAFSKRQTRSLKVLLDTPWWTRTCSLETLYSFKGCTQYLPRLVTNKRTFDASIDLRRRILQRDKNASIFCRVLCNLHQREHIGNPL